MNMGECNALPPKGGSMAKQKAISKDPNEQPQKNYKLSADERETIILFSDGDSIATIETCNKALINKLRKIYKEISSTEHSVTFECDKDLISYRPAKRKRGPMSDEHKAKFQGGQKKS
jgi:hypothetical protein